jgi:hypothetical protein
MNPEVRDQKNDVRQAGPQEKRERSNIGQLPRGGMQHDGERADSTQDRGRYPYVP